MKRNILAGFLCLGLILSLFSGCAGTEMPAPAPTTAPVVQELPGTEPTEAPALMETEPVEDLGPLTRISAGVLKRRADTVELYALGENLLVASKGETYHASSQTFDFDSRLTLVSPKDGTVLATYSYDLPERSVLKTVGETAMMVDTYWGSIDVVLDSSLTPLETYIPTAEVLPIEIDCEKGYCDGYWLSADLQRLYVLYSPEFDAAYDLFCVDLKTDTSRYMSPL